MVILNGKYNSAKVFTDNIDQSAISQIIELLNQPMSQNQLIRIMPDVHAGKGCTIGTTIMITDKVVPNLVGVDIGCGMETVKLKEKSLDFGALDKLIREKIPSGFSVRVKPHALEKKFDIRELHCYEHGADINYIRASLSLGTLGGGNHFIEVDKDDEDCLYLVIHSGSRHLGVEVATHYQNRAYEDLTNPIGVDTETYKKKLIANLRAERKTHLIESELAKLKETQPVNVPKHLAYVQNGLMKNYIHDMKIVQNFAMLNRQAIADDIISGLDLHIDEQFTTVHNYIDTEYMILRKGAVSAQKGEKLLIPINMRDGSLICTGLGNPDWNYSAPHGAGRIMSRSAAKDALTVAEYERQMDGIYSTSVGFNTIDESPMAYKPIDDIISNISDTVTINKVIKPVYNFKAG